MDRKPEIPLSERKLRARRPKMSVERSHEKKSLFSIPATQVVDEYIWRGSEAGIWPVKDNCQLAFIFIRLFLLKVYIIFFIKKANVMYSI